MPTQYHLFTDSNHKERFVFNYTLLYNYNTIPVDSYTLKVVLPEGATHYKVSLNALSQLLQVHLPIDAESIEEDLTYTTLDYFGRPTLVIKLSNVVPNLH